MENNSGRWPRGPLGRERLTQPQRPVGPGYTQAQSNDVNISSRQTSTPLGQNPTRQPENNVTRSPASPMRSYAVVAAAAESQSRLRIPNIGPVPPASSAAPLRTSADQPAAPLRRGSLHIGRGSPRSDTAAPSRRTVSYVPLVVPSFLKIPEFQKNIYDRESFRVGLIISTLHYEEYSHYREGLAVSRSSDLASPPTATAQVADAFFDPYGNPVCLKTRIMIVVHVFTDHFVAVPVFSYRGKGLSEKTAAKKREHLDIHDHRQTDNVRQNNLPLLTTEFMQDWHNPMQPRSSVYFTYPISLYFGLRVALVGELTSDSKIELINAYYNHINRPHLPTSVQVAERVGTATPGVAATATTRSPTVPPTGQAGPNVRR